jgi:hypothetical protein
MEKIDLSKKYKAYFTAKREPEVLEIGKAGFISIAGKGDPSATDFRERIEALYSVAYTIKFSCKELQKDFIVSKLEGLWWFDEKKFIGKNIVSSATEIPRSEWEYRLMIRVPEFVGEKDVGIAKDRVVQRKGIELVEEIKPFSMSEGKCVQMLHVGPYATEPDTLLKIAAFMEKNQLSRNGLHHEIYLSDFRKTDPAKLKTILREPVR